MTATTTRTVTVRSPGFRPMRVRVRRGRYLGTLTGGPGGPQFTRTECMGPKGVRVVLCEDDLNREDRDYAEPLTEAEALQLGMRRRRIPADTIDRLDAYSRACIRPTDDPGDLMLVRASEDAYAELYCNNGGEPIPVATVREAAEVIRAHYEALRRR